MPDEVEATTAAPCHRLSVVTLVDVVVDKLWRDRGQRWVERGNGHDALL
jgi:hypothetical protein